MSADVGVQMLPKKMNVNGNLAEIGTPFYADVFVLSQLSQFARKTKCMIFAKNAGN